MNDAICYSVLGCCVAYYWSCTMVFRQKPNLNCDTGAIVGKMVSSNTCIAAHNPCIDTVLTDSWEIKDPNPYKFTERYMSFCCVGHGFYANKV